MQELKSHIKIVDNAVPIELCERIIAEYHSSGEWVEPIIGGIVDRQFRNCAAIGLSGKDTIGKNPDVRAALDAELFRCASKAISAYAQYVPVSIGSDSGYDLLKYDEGGFYKTHIDSAGSVGRMVSCSFALNDDFDGGKWSFFNGEVVLDVPRGAAVMFPSNFLFPHEIQTVVKGTRFSVVTWFN